MGLTPELRRECARAFVPIAVLAAVLASRSAAGEPLDLSDPRPREVTVRFEISPDDRPGQVDARYTEPVAARLEPGPGAHERTLTIPARAVEATLLREQDPLPGTFSDFVWRFDARTGHVLQAGLSGVLRREVGWGPLRSRLEVAVRFHMDTLQTVGFRSERVLLGQRVHAFCPPGALEGCVAVEPTPLDATTGHVNAVGHVEATTRGRRLRTYSTLGEAVFSELGPGARAGIASPGLQVSRQGPALPPE